MSDDWRSAIKKMREDLDRFGALREQLKKDLAFSGLDAMQKIGVFPDLARMKADLAFSAFDQIKKLCLEPRITDEISKLKIGRPTIVDDLGRLTIGRWLDEIRETRENLLGMSLRLDPISIPREVFVPPSARRIADLERRVEELDALVEELRAALNPPPPAPVDPGPGTGVYM